MNRRDFLETVALSAAGLLMPIGAEAAILTNRREIALQCLGDKPGARFLDGRTGNGTVGLVPRIRIKTFPGTKWMAFRDANTGFVRLQCRGPVKGPPWLDGRTQNGSVGLAPSTAPPFSGTAWEVVELGADVVALRCLGAIEGPRWLDGRTQDGTVGLAPSTDPPFTGTRWRVSSYPVCIDSACD